jgi:hypothetical protein
MSEITRHDDYRQALADIKLRIQSAQVRAVFAVNSEMLALYWDIGRRLLLWQSEQGWGGRRWWSKWQATCTQPTLK